MATTTIQPSPSLPPPIEVETEVLSVQPQQQQHDLIPDDDDDDDPFERLRDRNASSEGKSCRPKYVSSTKKRKLIKIVLTGVDTNSSHEDEATTTSPRKRSSRTCVDKLMIEPEKRKATAIVSASDTDFNCIDDDAINIEMYGKDIVSDEVEDCFKFLEETHEDQDPEWIAFQNKLYREKLQRQINELDVLDEKRRKEIELIVQQQIREKQIQTENTLEKYKLRLNQDRAQKMARIEQYYRQKTASDNQKISETIKILHGRHQKETQAAMQQHRHQVQQQQQQAQQQQRRLLPDQIAAQAAAEWQQKLQQMQMKQSRQLQEFTAKGEDAKKKTESDYRRDRDKVRNEYEQKMTEVEISRAKAIDRSNSSAELLKARFLKRHMQKIMKQREELMQQMATGRYDKYSTSALSDGGDGVGRDQLFDSQGRLRSFKGTNRPSLLPNVSSPSDVIDNYASSVTGDHKKVGDELNPQSPIKSRPEWVTEMGGHIVLSGASARSNYRRTIMTQASRQVTVEVHNEGIWISIIGSNDPNEASGGTHSNTKSSNDHADSGNHDKDGTSRLADNREFLAWGVKACSFLESIICGEIPPGFDRLFDRLNKDTVKIHGGQIRCVMLDLRTSESTASSDRAAALHEYKEMVIADLEKRGADMNRMSGEAEKVAVTAETKLNEQGKIVESAQREVERALLIQEEFTNKFRSYLGPDGNPIPQSNPNDTQNLMKEVMRHRNDIAAARSREKQAKQALEDIQAKLQKLHAVAKNAKLQANRAADSLQQRRGSDSKTGHRGSSRGSFVGGLDHSESMAGKDASVSMLVQDVLGALKKAADKRRDNATQKSNGNAGATWMQSFPTLPSALKKYLWDKMHRRKQLVYLRPTPESLINEAKSFVRDTIITAQKREPTEEEMIEAERLYLLAVHPVASEALPPVPPTMSNDKWAEPGWMLNLDVPQDDDELSTSFILPRAKSFPILESNLSEMASASGRQAASLLHSSHLRCLASPLSLFAKASSPAETSTTLADTGGYSESDPFNISKEAMAAGYSFSRSSRITSRPPPDDGAMRKSYSDKEKSAELLPTAPMFSGSASLPNSLVATTENAPAGRPIPQADKKKAEPKKRRPSKTSTDPSPRNQRPKKSVDDTQSSTAPTSFNQFVQKQQVQQRQSQPQHSQQQKLQMSQQQRLRQEQLLAQQPKQQQYPQQPNQPSSRPLPQQNPTPLGPHPQQQHQQPNQHEASQQNYQNHSQRSQQRSPLPPRNPFQQQPQQQRLQQQQLQPQQQPQYPNSHSQQHTQYPQAYQSQSRQQAPQQPPQAPHQAQVQQQQQKFSTSQANQFRILQQQALSQSNSSRQLQPMPGNYPQQALQQPMNQFYGTPLAHPNSSMGYMPHQQQRPGFPNQHQLPGMPGGNAPGQQQQQSGQGMNNDQSDPLFMLK